MFVFIIRHGQAFGNSDTGRDRDRKLTDLGHKQAQAVGRFLQDHPNTPAHLFASPYVRTQETLVQIEAQINAAGNQATHTDDRLAAHLGLTEMLEVITDHTDKESIAIISHMPTVGQLVSLLVDGPTAAYGSMSTGEVVLIKINPDDPIANGQLLNRYRLSD